MTEEPAAVQRARRGRSPSYPGIALDLAIDRARELERAERRHPAPTTAIHEHWGYKPNSGPAAVTLAALKKFGLLADEGAGGRRLARLTDLAFEILLNPDPAEAIREAALTPPIHRELWEQYHGVLPSDKNLRYELKRNRRFTDRGVDEFISQFRRTVAYAGLDRAASVDRQGAPEVEAPSPREGAVTMSSPQTSGPAVAAAGIPGVITIPIPLVDSTRVQIAGEFPISEAAWKQLLAVLDAMKPGLVKNGE